MLLAHVAHRLATSFGARSDGGGLGTWLRSAQAAHASSSPFSTTHAARGRSGGGGAAGQFARRQLQAYRFPAIDPADCEQHFISGWGPGGSRVNALQNAVHLRHKPTNVVVKVHESRLLQENVKIAFERLKFAVDRHLNGANSYEEQFKRLQREREQKAKRVREKRREIRSAASSSTDDSPRAPPNPPSSLFD